MNAQAPIQDLAVIDTTVELIVRRPPALVLEEAHKAAVALKDVIDKKPKPVMMNGEQYLEYEDWQTLARFYGISAKVTTTEYIRYGDISGFTARAVALRSDGYELSAAEADCLNDEEKWRSRARYEWRDGANGKREKVKVGEEAVPLFQLKSMAQTRACAKAFRNVLSWVVVLAGYRPTPAEEIDGMVDGVVIKSDRKAQDARPAATAQGQPTAPSPEGLTKVKDVTVKKGNTKGKDWTRYAVKFEDGRQGGTFDAKLGEACTAAKASGEAVNPEIEKGEKGNDLRSLQPVVASRPLEPSVERGPDEPVDGPERVLTARKITRGDGSVYFVVQTSKRELFSDNLNHANEAVAARKAGLGVVPSFDVGPWQGVDRKVNRLQKLIVEHSEASEAVADVKKALAVAETSEEMREPGSDDE